MEDDFRSLEQPSLKISCLHRLLAEQHPSAAPEATSVVRPASTLKSVTQLLSAVRIAVVGAIAVLPRGRSA